MRIVFMGTPDFAVPCLKSIIEYGYDVVSVFTQPDKPVGRKMVLTAPPVKKLATEYNIPVYQPSSLKNSDAVNSVKELNPDLIIVVAYGKILPSSILNIPKSGCINIHGSLLPKYRGAAPIQWSVINGEKTTGVTSMFMDEGMDTGDILLKREMKISENETSGELFERLSSLGASTLIDTLNLLESNSLTPKKQNSEDATYAPMLDKTLSPIDWNDTAQNIHNKVRGLSPWPLATTVLNGMKLKIHGSLLTDFSKSGVPGEIVNSDGKIVVLCGDLKCVEILKIQSEGGKVMNTADFLRGHPITVGEIFRS